MGTRHLLPGPGDHRCRAPRSPLPRHRRTAPPRLRSSRPRRDLRRTRPPHQHGQHLTPNRRHDRRPKTPRQRHHQSRTGKRRRRRTLRCRARKRRRPPARSGLQLPHGRRRDQPSPRLTPRRRNDGAGPHRLRRSAYPPRHRKTPRSQPHHRTPRTRKDNHRRPPGPGRTPRKRRTKRLARARRRHHGDYLYDRRDYRAAVDAYAIVTADQADETPQADEEAVIRPSNERQRWSTYQQANALFKLARFQECLPLYEVIAESATTLARDAQAKADAAKIELRLRGEPVPETRNAG